jgi:hypothetical protein
VNVSVLFPWRDGCWHRQKALDWVTDRYEAEFPEWEHVIGESPAGPFSRSAAIMDAARRSTGDMLVVADTDVWCHPGLAVLAAIDTGWAVPHDKIHRLSPESTQQVLDGGDWRGLPLSTDNKQDAKPYRGNETGTLVVLRRDVLFDVSPDPRFVGWGQEDHAWGIALRCLVGAPWRGTDDLVHLWHPPQPRKNRVVGSDAGMALLRRYRTARRDPARMRALISEVADA